MVRPMVHSTKHYVQPGLRTIVAGAVESHIIVDAVASNDLTGNFEVLEGDSIKAVYIEHWIRSSGASPGSFIFAVYKISGIGTLAFVAQMAALFDWENKKNILFTSQALTNDNDADAIVIHRGWMKIPKSKQRFGLGDRLVMATSAVGVDHVVCGLEAYKEYQ